LFTKVLKTALATCGTTVKVLTSVSVSAALDLDDDVSFGDMSISVSSWLQLQEEQNQMVLYQADWHDSPWNTLCGQQCDLILLVGNGTDRPQVNSAEQELYKSTKHVPKALIMLHVNPSADYAPQDTRRWVEARKGVQMQLQIRLHTHNLWYDTTHYKSDFTRLARMLTGNAVGLVLGGGGARGLAHLGLLKVLEEYNIPVDVIGGTSIGSFVGALYAEEDRYLSIFPRAVKFSRRMGNVWNYIRDLTLPITAYFHGYGFNHEIKSALGRNKKIEDLWLPYFCVTTDLTASQERIHINGTLWRCVRHPDMASKGLLSYCRADLRACWVFACLSFAGTCERA
jgi:lysophospholipid hydrolase